jgi:hypothetical protein
MFTFVTNGSECGRLGNQIIRSLAVSFICEKHNLYCEYGNYDIINNKLGIPLFIGNTKFDNSILLLDSNYFNLLNSNELFSNLNPNTNFFQTKEICHTIYNYLKNSKQYIINKNNFKERYNNNNDIFIHIRLGDAESVNPGKNYYFKAIQSVIQYDNIYISSDTPQHPIINEIINIYPFLKILNYDEINTIQFASTCKYVILSHGTFSAIIGYLSFFSNIYYPEYDIIWHGDVFSIEGWNRINKSLYK